MTTMKIKIGDLDEMTVFLDGPGYLTIGQGDHEISLSHVMAIALAEFIVAHQTEMLESHKRHLKGKANGRGN